MARTFEVVGGPSVLDLMISHWYREQDGGRREVQFQAREERADLSLRMVVNEASRENEDGTTWRLKGRLRILGQYGDRVEGIYNSQIRQGIFFVLHP